MIRQPFTVAIALRYLRARSRSAFISFISAVSMLGIAVAVAVLIVVMAVIDGFETELEERILSMSPDASFARYPDGFVDDWPALRAESLVNPRVTGAAPFIEGQGMLIVGDRLLGVSVRGADPVLEGEVSTIGSRLDEGDFGSIAMGWNVVIGRALADELDVGMGDRVTLLLPEVEVTPAGVWPRNRRLTVTGIFDVGLQEFDRGLAIVGLDVAARLYRSGGRASGISLNVVDRYNALSVAEEVARSARSRHGGEYWYSDWSRKHVNIFRSIELTKPLLFIMLSLVVAIAAFNIVSTLIMIVREKRGDIAILRSMGAVPRNILNVFLAQGACIGLIGVLGGVGLGLLLVANLETVVGWIESGFGIDLLSADVYLIDDLPAEARPLEVARISGLAFVLAVLATLYPAYRASRQPPAEALRYE